ncbi:MAG: flagellar hook-basal body complex protein FliE [Planctomycetes bacterium]|jgi:flagellar hook-basal body complex protein FliE|nr:flagellar hook-basal body complex protein FliE [Planctomycetota bacterium]
MVNFDPNISSGMPGIQSPIPQGPTGAGKSTFVQAVETAGKYVSQVNEMQNGADASIQDLLSGKTSDINSVVSAVAKADVSFKLLVGVRNKLIEAYKQTMNMPL